MGQYLLFWSDALIYLLVTMLSAFVWYVRGREHLRRPWRKIARDKAAMVSLVVLMPYVLIGLLDSVHFQPQAADKQANSINEAISLFDWWATPMRSHGEKTYSRPFAVVSYSREYLTRPDGSQGWDYPRLAYGGAHLRNADVKRWPDVAKIAAGGAAKGALLWLVVVGGLGAFVRQLVTEYSAIRNPLPAGEGRVRAKAFDLPILCRLLQTPLALTPTPNAVDLSDAEPSPSGKAAAKRTNSGFPEGQGEGCLKSPHPNLLPEGEGTQRLKSTALTPTPLPQGEGDGSRNSCSCLGYKQWLLAIATDRSEIPWRAVLLTLLLLLIGGWAIADLAAKYHVLGTDKVGQDVLYQSLKSIRTGLVIGTLTTLVMLPFAVLMGMLAGFFQGWVDDMVQYLYTTLNAIPSVLLIAASILMVQVYMANHEEQFASLALRADLRLVFLCAILGITNWTGLCRLLRGETLKLREMEFVQAARALGVRSWVILARHILPNLVHIILISVVLDFSALVLAEAVLSYVNIGVDPTTQSWGNMINSARLELARDPVVWWSLTAAFLLMFALVLAANLFADAVRDALDPRRAEA